jgi:hypothetical protein
LPRLYKRGTFKTQVSLVLFLPFFVVLRIFGSLLRLSLINAKNGVIVENYVQISFHCSIYSISTIDNKEGRIILKKNAFRMLFLDI